MPLSQPIYVLDTNILIDYPNIIPGGKSAKPEEPTVDLTGKHLVVPSAVIRELSSFKREKSERGKTARVVLKRLREMAEQKHLSLNQSYHMKDYIIVPGTEQTISILPVHRDFSDAVPFCPDDTDMDGQIILTALATAFIINDLPLHSIAHQTIDNLGDNTPFFEGVILLTNDNGLAIRARERGLLTSRYGYKSPPPYTGRRDLIVPNELFGMFYYGFRIEGEAFKELMPDEPRLIANEFIVMYPERLEDFPYYDPADDPYFTNVGRYDAIENAIVPLKFVRSSTVKPLSVGQAMYAEVLANPTIPAVICTGPAGSGKTYMATAYSYNACVVGQYIGVAIVPCENTNKIGALPGDLSDKMDPQVRPFKNALRNYLLNEDPIFRKEIENLRKYGSADAPSDEQECECNDACECMEPEKPNGKSNSKKRKREENDEEEMEAGKTSTKQRRKQRRTYRTKRKAPQKSIMKMLDERIEMIWRSWFVPIPIENARGQDFAYHIAIYDEFQDQNASQADTLIKRIGANGKIVITGDIEQIHSPYLDEENNGIVYASGLLFDDPMVARISFTEDDVVRHPLVKLIAERQKQAKVTNDDDDV